MGKITVFLIPLLITPFLWAVPHPSSSIDPQVSENCKTVLAKARQMTNEDIEYDPGYYKMSYPGGDVAANIGVCTDIIVRSLRTIGMDLQELVHEDMKSHFSMYPKKYGSKKDNVLFMWDIIGRYSVVD